MYLNALFRLALANSQNRIVADAEVLPHCPDSLLVASHAQHFVHIYDYFNVFEVQLEVFGVKSVDLCHLAQVKYDVELLLAIEGLSLGAALVQMRV